MSARKTAVINGKTVDVIDCTPSWTTAMGIYLMVLEEGTREGKKLAREGLMELARAVDKANAA